MKTEQERKEEDRKKKGKGKRVREVEKVGEDRRGSIVSFFTFPMPKW